MAWGDGPVLAPQAGRSAAGPVRQFLSGGPALLTFMQSWPDAAPSSLKPGLVNLDSPCYDYPVIEHDPMTKDVAMTTTSSETDDNVVTDERAKMLAAHAIHVQGGFSDAEIEKARAEKQLAASPGSIDWAKMEAEVHAALLAKVAALPTTDPVEDPAVDPTPPTTSHRADVTAVLASVDQGAALRDRIKAMQAELKIHEDNIKDALGNATEGVDNSGRVVVRYPFRNRSGLSKDKVKDILTPTQYADCEQVTEYRTLLYGEG